MRKVMMLYMAAKKVNCAGDQGYTYSADSVAKCFLNGSKRNETGMNRAEFVSVAKRKVLQPFGQMITHKISLMQARGCKMVLNVSLSVTLITLNLCTYVINFHL
jgi:hypothetical protein